MQTFTVATDEAGARLDQYLAGKITELSRSPIQKLCTDEKVKVNGYSQPNKYKVKANDKVSVEFDPADLDDIPDIDLPILYEDDDCIVVDKPTGVLTHSKGGFNPEATIASFIRPKLVDLEGERAGIVHRLDRGTSGVIICAKTSEALSWLQKQFSSRKVHKEYVAVVGGSLSPPEAVIEAPIARSPRNPKTFTVSSKGRAAITEYQTIGTGNGYSLVKLLPMTGRTHQLRVHLKHLGHPIVGDPFYGGPPADRLMLHAWQLKIRLPNKKQQIFESPVPPVFQEVVNG